MLVLCKPSNGMLTKVEICTRCLGRFCYTVVVSLSTCCCCTIRIVLIVDQVRLALRSFACTIDLSPIGLRPERSIQAEFCIDML